MATPHPALDAAVNQFAQQPGVTPAEVSALRAAIASDADLTQRLDHAATSGALHGFAPDAPGAADQPIGNYDRASGTVALPASAFPAPGAAAGGDLHAVDLPPVAKAIARPDEHRTRDRTGNVNAREAVHIRMQGQTLALCNQDFERDFEEGPQFLFRTEVFLPVKPALADPGGRSQTGCRLDGLKLQFEPMDNAAQNFDGTVGEYRADAVLVCLLHAGPEVHTPQGRVEQMLASDATGDVTPFALVLPLTALAGQSLGDQSPGFAGRRQQR
ncbi:hypothetical protein [Luteibacter yeojuensis]